MRGFKPSYFQAATDDMHADLEKAKEANLRRYVERVRAGLPIFDDEQTETELQAGHTPDVELPSV
jgi:Ribonuclease G/E